MNNGLRILYPGQLYPEKSGGYLRTFNIAKLALKRFKNITVYGYDRDLKYTNITDNIKLVQTKQFDNNSNKVKYYFSGIFSTRFSLISNDGAFDDPYNTVFQIEGPLFYNLLIKKNIKNYILNEHNVYWELYDMKHYSLKSKIYSKFAYKRDKSIELNAVNNAAHTIVCSEQDKQKLLEELPCSGENITVIPNCVSFKEYENYMDISKHVDHDKSKYRKSLKILFIGTFIYPPNIDALKTIYNIAKKCGKNIEFIVLGKNPPISAHQDNVRVLGYVKDIKRYISESDICIAPLRYGSGTRFKILEYMAMGKPVISTSKGAEGIDYTHNKNIIIEDDFLLYPKLIEELTGDEKKMNEIGENAMKLIKNKYDWDLYTEDLINIYKKF